MKTINQIKICSLCMLMLVFAASCKDSSTENSGTNVNAESKEEMISTDVVENPTEITFEMDSYNFGDINQGDTVSHDFKFTNTGSHDLIITGARGSCGCTVPVWPKRPIKPGESDVVKVQFNSKNKKGAQNKTVTVTANTKPSETKIYFTGNVIVPN